MKNRNERWMQMGLNKLRGDDDLIHGGRASRRTSRSVSCSCGRAAEVAARRIGWYGARERRCATKYKSQIGHFIKSRSRSQFTRSDGLRVASGAALGGGNESV